MASSGYAGVWATDNTRKALFDAMKRKEVYATTGPRMAPDGKSPTFLVAALKDPYGANRDRVQIVKGWVGKDGKTQEKVYDVVWGDAETRKLG